MGRIHQIYCTHCTFASSVFEQRRGDGADRVCGYSPRASSLDADDLLRWYQQIVPHLHYRLPEDVPPEARLRMDASTAPQRLVYVPAVDGSDMLALVCYRRTDREDLPESSFAHVLVHSPPNRHGWWSNLACLELWGASRWVTEDSAEIPFVLESFSSLQEMLGGRAPRIGRDLVLKFLTAPPGEDWGDAAAVVPPRWRQMPPEERRGLFTDTLSGFLGAGARILLVAEPSVAALWFYGMLRLLPNIPLFATLGFSTFEPQGENPKTPLAATCFDDPTTSDLPPAAYSGSAFAVNTFLDRRSENPASEAFYAPFMVDRLIRHGWEAVERFLVRLQVGGAQTLEDLEVMTSRLGGVRAE